MGIKIRLFGDFSIQENQKVMAGLNTKHQALITYLALRVNQPVQRSEIAYKLWLDSSEEQALTNLRKALHIIKQNFFDGEHIQSDARSLQLNLSNDDQLDIFEFTSAINNAEESKRANKIEAEQKFLESAIELYQGDLLPNLYDEWIISERERLRSVCLNALDRLIALLELRKYYRDAIKFAQRLLQMDDIREETYRTLIRLHALNDDRATALNIYHICARKLSQELGVEPDVSTRELYERLLKNQASSLYTEISSAPVSHVLVAREKEWQILLSEWKISVSGNLRMLILKGEAGIGKTRLAEDLLIWASRQGINTASAKCYSSEGQTSFGSIISWLRDISLQELEPQWRAELSRVMPELQDEESALQPITETWQKRVFFESMTRAVLSQKDKLILLLDDIQWCDVDSLEWLQYFMRFDKEAKILVLATLRSEELSLQPALQTLITELRAEGQVTEIELKRLDETQTLKLGKHLLGKEISEMESNALFRASEGVPLFVVELTREGLRVDPTQKIEISRRESEAFSSSIGITPRLRAVIEGRLSRISTHARVIAELAAVLGKEFDFHLLRKVSELPENETMHALDELWHRQIVRERDGLYDFSHDKLREVTLLGLSPVRSSWLHQRVAEAFEFLLPENESARIAFHFECANLKGKTAEYYFRAANYAQKIFAFDDALEYLAKVILFEQDGEKLANLYEQKGDVLKMLDHREEAFQEFHRADTISKNFLQKARLNRKQSTLTGRFDFEVARQKYQDALKYLELDKYSSGYWMEWLETQLAWSEVIYWTQNLQELSLIIDQMQEPIEQYGTTLQKIQYRFRVISNAFTKEQFQLNANHVTFSQDTLELTVALENSHYISNAKRQLGMVALFANQLDVSETAFRESIVLCTKNGDQNSMLIARTYLSLVHRRQHKKQEVLTDTNLLEESLGHSAPHPHYRGVVDANRAWLAYLDNHIKEAKQLAHEALEIWRLQKNPFFEWIALIILLAIAVDEKNTKDAYVYTQDLIKPLQCKLTPEVDSALHAVVEVGFDNPKQILARCRLVVEKAKEAGYL